MNGAHPRSINLKKVDIFYAVNIFFGWKVNVLIKREKYIDLCAKEVMYKFEYKMTIKYKFCNAIIYVCK